MLYNESIFIRELAGSSLGELALQLADELEQAEALRRLVRPHFRNGERAADAVEEREGAAEAARVALAPVDGVEACAGRVYGVEVGLDYSPKDAAWHRTPSPGRRR